MATKLKKESKKELTMEDILSSLKGDFLPLRKGQPVKGVILQKNPNSLVLDIGGKSLGLVAEKAFIEARDFVKHLEVGDEVEGKVIIPETPDGYTIVSLRDTAKDFIWKKIEKVFDNEEEITASVKGASSSGLLVSVFGLTGFVPKSHLLEKNASQINSLSGKKITLKIIDIDKEANRIILSERVIYEKEEMEAKKKAIANLKEGDIYDGVVSGIYDFGVFVKIPVKVGKKVLDIEGLVRNSEVSWKKFGKIQDVINEGDKVKVKVIEIKEDKFALSIKQAQKDPWEEAANKYKQDAKFEGEVVKISDFGAFVELEPGIEGLLHITKIPPATNLKVGDRIKVYIDEIDIPERRISLGLVLTSKPIGYK